MAAELKNLVYDAPLSFTEPTEAWCNRNGGRPNNRTDTLTEKDVPPTDLTGKWILITGSNNGIGKEAALTFASWGANLVLACREPRPNEGHPADVVDASKAAAKAAGHVSDIEWWKVDFADLTTVEALAKRWLATDRPLDILCNNAGVGSSPGGTNPGEVFKTKDGFEFVHQINLLSHVLLTMYLLPSLAKAAEPRVVCTTSCFHFLGKYNIANFNGEPGNSGSEGVQYYKNNKLYFQIWLTELQEKLLKNEKYKHITVNGFHPGYVASGIWTMQRTFFLAWLLNYVLLLASKLFGINPKQGSMGLVYVATAPECGRDPKTQGGSDSRGKGGGRYFNRIWEQESMPHCRNADARSRVWHKVAEELDLQKRGLLKQIE